MSNRSHLALAICVSMPKVFADRFAALEDTAPFDDYESISTSNTASKSIVKSLSFVISWIVSILVLRVTVLLVGKAYTWLTIRYVNMRDDLLADHGMDERSRVKRRYKDSRSVGSIGSLSELLHFDDQTTAYSGGDSFVSGSYSYSTGTLDDYSESAYSGDASTVLSRLTGFSSVFGGVRKKKAHNDRSERDDEEGSYISRFGSSVRSRFANHGKRSGLNESSGHKSNDSSPNKLAKSVGGDSNVKSGNTTDREEKQNTSKQGKRTQQKTLDNYLSKSKQERNLLPKSSFAAAGSTIGSMTEVDLKDRKSRR